MSAFISTSDIDPAALNVRFVPKADILIGPAQRHEHRCGQKAIVERLLVLDRLDHRLKVTDPHN
jgi:hypothetical protein